MGEGGKRATEPAGGSPITQQHFWAAKTLSDSKWFIRKNLSGDFLAYFSWLRHLVRSLYERRWRVRAGGYVKESFLADFPSTNWPRVILMKAVRIAKKIGIATNVFCPARESLIFASRTILIGRTVSASSRSEIVSSHCSHRVVQRKCASCGAYANFFRNPLRWMEVKNSWQKLRTALSSCRSELQWSNLLQRFCKGGSPRTCSNLSR